MGPNVSIYSAGHETSVLSRVKFVEFGHPIRIEDDCWIDGGVTILPNVTIGRGARLERARWLRRASRRTRLRWGRRLGLSRRCLQWRRRWRIRITRLTTCRIGIRGYISKEMMVAVWDKDENRHNALSCLSMPRMDQSCAVPNLYITNSSGDSVG